MKLLICSLIIAISAILIIVVPCLAEGEVESLKQIEYWDNGKIRQCTMYDTDGRLKAKAFCRNDGTAEKIEKFDAYGNKTEEAFYDQRGVLKTGIDGWAAMRWFYGGYQLMSQISYDEDGVPIERKQYSESGRLMLRQYRDELDLSPYEGAQMHMMLGGRNIPYELIKYEGGQSET